MAACNPPGLFSGDVRHQRRIQFDQEGWLLAISGMRLPDNELFSKIFKGLATASRPALRCHCVTFDGRRKKALSAGITQESVLGPDLWNTYFLRWLVPRLSPGRSLPDRVRRRRGPNHTGWEHGSGPEISSHETD